MASFASFVSSESGYEPKLFKEFCILSRMKKDLDRIKEKIQLSKTQSKRLSVRYAKRMVCLSNLFIAVVSFWSKFTDKMSQFKSHSDAPIWTLGGIIRFGIYKLLPEDALPRSKLAAKLVSSIISAMETSSWFLISALLIWNESAASEDGKTTTMNSWMSVFGLDVWAETLNTSPVETFIATKDISEEFQKDISRISSKQSLNSNPSASGPTSRRGSQNAMVPVFPLMHSNRNNNKPIAKLATIIEAEAHVERQEYLESKFRLDMNVARFVKQNKFDLFSAITSGFRPGVFGCSLSVIASIVLRQNKIAFLNFIFSLGYLWIRFSHLFIR